jgi:hypothetical protein
MTRGKNQAVVLLSIIETKNGTPLTCARVGRRVVRAWSKRHVARARGGHHVIHASQ